MIEKRKGHAMAHVKGNVYVFGGLLTMRNWEVYSIKDDVWKSIAPLPANMTITEMTATIHRNTIWIAGEIGRIILYYYRSKKYRTTQLSKIGHSFMISHRNRLYILTSGKSM